MANLKDIGFGFIGASAHRRIGDIYYPDVEF